MGEYVRLTKALRLEPIRPVPFHSEKTPSFSVSPDRQIYHCFGCGKGGGVINFIMEIENLSFPEAVEFLAKRVGMTMPEQEDNREAKKAPSASGLEPRRGEVLLLMSQQARGQACA